MTSQTTTKRLTSEERREQIVAAATAVFGSHGYVGTTTDDIARAAGVSQPYVVRLFGSKEALFLTVLEDSVEQLAMAFRDAIAATVDRDPEERKHRMGEAYTTLLTVRGLHQILSQAFLLGAHPVIGPAARAGFARIWRLLREEAGFDVDRANTFLAMGMLINTLLGLRISSAYGRDAGMTEILDMCFPDNIDAMLGAAPKVEEPW